MQVDIFDKIRKSSGGPIGQYRDRADGYFAFPKLEGELGPHMRFHGQGSRSEMGNGLSDGKPHDDRTDGIA